MRVTILTMSMLLGVIAMAEPLSLTGYEVVDLSHSYDGKTLYWPTSPTTFELTQLSYGVSDGGYFYSANSFASPEHGGTHLDAPIHFSENGWSVDQIPLSRLMGAAVVIDVTEKVRHNRDYRLTTEDIELFEKTHGPIQANTFVLLRTGFAEYWPEAQPYLGDDTPGDASNLHFPAYGAESARMLVEQRRVAGLGLDTASIDYGPSKDFIVHRIVGRNNAVGFENLTNLDRLPPTGATIIALPMKIGGGSGGPLRIIAFLPR